MKKITTIILLTVITIAAITCKKTPEIPSGNKIVIGETTTDSISYFTIKVSTTIEAMEGNVISQYGHCWSTEPEPTISDSITSHGKLTQAKTYSSELTNLTNNTTYYVRSYITYSNGTVYGSEQSIITLKTGKPSVLTTEVTDVTLYTAVCGGIVQADSGLAVTTRGVCWDTDSIFTITNCLDTTIVGNGLGSFTSDITELDEGVTYYVATYATNEKGTSYGEVIQFSTVPISIPLVTTTEITEITTTSATSGGNVTSNGNGTVTARGICWNTTGNPTLQNSLGLTTDGNSTGSFTSEITNLNEGVTYFATAYATNEKGTSYGEIVQFSTVFITIPIVITTSPTNITTTSATNGGNITSNGNGTVTSRGVCWNTTGNPSLQNSLGHTTDGSGTGSFISVITGLSDGVTYYVSAYATNEKGTSYGEIKIFETIDDPCDGITTINYEGQTYNIVGIADQCWMKENLNYETGNSWCYNENPTNCTTYGRLYDWATIMNGETSSNTVPSGVQGICPSGWHLPSDEEWKTLEMYLGMSQSEANNTGWRGTDEGKKLKSTSGWDSGGNGTDAVGFSALPGGNCDLGGHFSGLGYFGDWWLATEYSSTRAWVRGLPYNTDKINRGNSYKEYGFSVRCVKD